MLQGKIADNTKNHGVLLLITTEGTREEIKPNISDVIAAQTNAYFTHGIYVSFAGIIR